MAEYIECEALLDYIDKRIPKLIASSDGKHIVCVETIREVIVNFPTADVAEIVRCKDCVNFEYTLCGWCNEFERPITLDDFCSYGERKER